MASNASAGLSWRGRSWAPWAAALGAAATLHLLVLQASAPDRRSVQSSVLGQKSSGIAAVTLVQMQRAPASPLEAARVSNETSAAGIQRPAPRPLETRSNPDPPAFRPNQGPELTQSVDRLPQGRTVEVAASDRNTDSPGQLLARIEARPVDGAVSQELGDPAEFEGPPPGQAALRGLPTYAADLPSSFVQPMQVRRLGGPAAVAGEPRAWAHGQGSVNFARQTDGAYTLGMELQWGARGQLEMHSQGQTSGAGLEPERLTDRRRGRARTAANLNRTERLARFSGGAAPVELAESAQDRLTWLLQLPALVRADPSLMRPGAVVWLQVVGARGGSQLWRMECLGPEALTLPDGTQRGQTWRWRRSAENAYDVQVEAWLAADAGPMPSLVRLTSVPSGGVLEFWPAP